MSMGTGLARKRARSDVRRIWTNARRRKFLEHLARTCNVAASARVAGMATNSPYALRNRDAAFAEAWDQALMEGYDRLEASMFDRAMNGKVETVTRGAVVEERRTYSDNVALTLLRMHRERVERKRAATAGRAPDDLLAVIRERLDRLHDRKDRR